MKPLLIILSFLLLSSPLFGQSQRPETIIIPVSGIGDVSNTRKLILENTLTDELKKHFRIVPQEKFSATIHPDIKRTLVAMSERTGLSISQVTDEVLYAGLVEMQEL